MVIFLFTGFGASEGGEINSVCLEKVPEMGVVNGCLFSG